MKLAIVAIGQLTKACCICQEGLNGVMGTKEFDSNHQIVRRVCSQVYKEIKKKECLNHSKGFSGIFLNVVRMFSCKTVTTYCKGSKGVIELQDENCNSSLKNPLKNCAQ